MTTNPTARDIHRHDQQTAEQNAVLDQFVQSVAANLADGIEPGELAVIAAKTFLGDPGRACTMAGFAIVRLAQITTDLKANEDSEDARLAIAEDNLAKTRTELAYALHALTTAETELEKVRGQYTDTRRHNDLLTAELADQQHANTTWANENQRLRDRLFADKPVVDAALAWVEMYETSDNGVRGSKTEDDLCDAVEQYRVMDMALDAAHTEAEVAR